MTTPRALRQFAIAITVLFGPVVLLAFRQYQPAAEHEAIAYRATAPTDGIERLQRQIDAGEVTLDFDPQHGYLLSLLRYLDVPLSSQGLVFSKTSLQSDRIAPFAPRALYFNDAVYVGSVRGSAMLEIASVDPKLGAVFYTLDQQEASTRPVFQREGSRCLQCHDSAAATGGVPGFLFRSVYPDRQGNVIAPGASPITTDRTPLQQRWGGWYVTGTHGVDRHMGNLRPQSLAYEVTNKQQYIDSVQLGENGNVTDLRDRFDTSRLLTPHSDIVALMVLAHQVYLHNLITAAGYAARISGADSHLAREAAERMVQGLMFVEEAPFAGPIEGTSGFAKDFAARGPRDRQGRSLRDFDLAHRLFRYRLSYLIYSEGFDGLPATVKAYAYQRLRDVLSGADQSAPFSHLPPAERQDILGILTDTKPDFAPAESK